MQLPITSLLDTKDRHLQFYVYTCHRLRRTRMLLSEDMPLGMRSMHCAGGHEQVLGMTRTRGSRERADYPD